MGRMGERVVSVAGVAGLSLTRIEAPCYIGTPLFFENDSKRVGFVLASTGVGFADKATKFRIRELEWAICGVRETPTKLFIVRIIAVDRWVERDLYRESTAAGSPLGRWNRFDRPARTE